MNMLKSLLTGSLALMLCACSSAPPMAPIGLNKVPANAGAPAPTTQN